MHQKPVPLASEVSVWVFFSLVIKSQYFAVIRNVNIVLGYVRKMLLVDGGKLTAIVQGNSKYLGCCKQFWLATFKEN